MRCFFLPTITYKGRLRSGANMGRLGWWTWGEAREVTDEWLEANKAEILGGDDFVVEGYKLRAFSVGEAKSDTPNESWTKGDIMGWLDENGVSYRSTSTKKTLLAKVNESLAPSEEPINEAEEATTTTESDE